jgi:hypothetical protein
VACSRPFGKVLEFATDGTVVWSWTSPPSCYDALEQENGNLLIASDAGLLEVGRNGNVIREILKGNIRRISQE